jgi:hypothetical protein
MGKSLSKEEANVIHKDIGEAVSKELGVELRWKMTCCILSVGIYLYSENDFFFF